jgi:multicomponent Na+:H+ antiporter subunit C
VSIVLAFVIGVLYAAGVYMMMRRSIVKLIMGLALLGYATNLLIFVLGGLSRGAPPVIPLGAVEPPRPFADPLPQALILTAIVIGFGVQAFATVLIKEAYQRLGSDNIDDLQGAENKAV